MDPAFPSSVGVPKQGGLFLAGLVAMDDEHGVVNLAGARLSAVEVLRRVQAVLMYDPPSHLDLSGNTISVESLVAIAATLGQFYADKPPPYLTTLRLGDLDRIGASAVSAIARLLEIPSVRENIQHVSFAGWRLVDVPFEPPARALLSKAGAAATSFSSLLSPTTPLHRLVGGLRNCASLQSIVLRGCRLTPSSLLSLAAIFQTHLLELDLSSNMFCAAVPPAATPYTTTVTKGPRKGPAPKLTPGTARDPRAAEDAAAAAAAGDTPDDVTRAVVALHTTSLALFPSKLNGVFVHRAAAVFASALVSPLSCALKNLDLSSCSMTDEVGVAIAAALGDNTSLQFLNLSSNRLGSPTALMMAAALATNCHLRELRMGFQPLSTDATSALVRVLSTNTTLTFMGLENTFSNTSTPFTGVAAVSSTRPAAGRPVVNVTPAKLRGSHGSEVPATGSSVNMLATVSYTTSVAASGGTVFTKGPPPPRRPLITELIAPHVGEAPQALTRLWMEVEASLQVRPTYCRVVLEYPERSRLPSAQLSAMDLEVEDEDGDDGMNWIRGVVDKRKTPKWTLEQSVWAGRATESDSHDFFDTATVLGRAFESDWAHTRLHRVIKSDEERAAVKPILKAKYAMLRELFKFFASQSGSAFSMSFTQFTEMRKAMGMDNPAKNAELDMVFFSSDIGTQGDKGRTTGRVDTGRRDKLATDSGIATGPLSPHATGSGSPAARIPGLGPASLVTSGSEGALGSLERVPALKSVVKLGDKKGDSATSQSPTKTSVTLPPLALGSVVEFDNPTHALTRAELLESFVRLALTFYKEGGGSGGGAGGGGEEGVLPALMPQASSRGRTASGSGTARSTGSEVDTPMGRPGEASPIVSAIRSAVDNHLVPTAVTLLGIPPGQLDDTYSNLFRRNRMYSEEVDGVFRRFESVTQKLFQRYMDDTHTFIYLPQWMTMLQHLGVFDGSIHDRTGGQVALLSPPHVVLSGGLASPLRPMGASPMSPFTAARSPRVGGRIGAAHRSRMQIGSFPGVDGGEARTNDFSDRDARLLFLYSIMTVVDETHRPTKLAKLSNHTCLTYMGFLEALSRLADSSVCPVSTPLETRIVAAGRRSTVAPEAVAEAVAHVGAGDLPRASSAAVRTESGGGERDRDDATGIADSPHRTFSFNADDDSTRAFAVTKDGDHAVARGGDAPPPTGRSGRRMDASDGVKHKSVLVRAGGAMVRHVVTSESRNDGTVPHPPTSQRGHAKPTVALHNRTAVPAAMSAGSGTLGAKASAPKDPHTGLISEAGGEPISSVPTSATTGIGQRRSSTGVAASGAAAASRRQAATALEPVMIPEPPAELHARLEIMLTHLAVAENISLRGIERRYVK